jgi:hypothetical protein
VLAFAAGIAVGYLVFCWWRGRPDSPVGTTVTTVARGLLPICLVLAVCSLSLGLSSATAVAPIIVMAAAGIDVGFLVFAAARRRPQTAASSDHGALTGVGQGQLDVP